MARCKTNRYHLANVINSMLRTSNSWRGRVKRTQLGFLPLKMTINVELAAYDKPHAITHMPAGKRFAAWRNIHETKRSAKYNAKSSL